MSIGPERLASAVSRIRETGFVLLDDRLPADLVAELHGEYMRALHAKIAKSGIEAAPPGARSEHHDRVLIDFHPLGGNHDLNRWNMHLPSRRPFLDSRLIADPMVLDVVESLLGSECVLVTIASDTPFPGAGFQNVHQDDDLLRITVNVPLVDFREDNAPLEVWPGSHLSRPERGAAEFSERPFRLGARQMQRRAREIPSRRLLLKAGSFLVRDQRMMHRGTANLSSEPRPMLSLLYFAAPRRIPPRRLSDAAAGLALRVRQAARARAGGRGRSTELLSKANTAGRLVEYLAGSDRDYRRRIPADLWAALTPRARRVLRLASVEGAAGPPGSVLASGPVLWHACRLAFEALRHGRDSAAGSGARRDLG